MDHPASLPLQNNYITTHTLEGDSIFLPSNIVSDTPTYKPIPPSKSVYADLHEAPSVPAILDRQSNKNDIVATMNLIQNNKIANAVPQSGVVLRRTDTPPGGISPMHRTLSVDYGVIVSGEMELILESGEKKRLKAGDTVVQRATMHQWRNPSETEWCRMVVVMMPMEDMVVNGRKLEQEFRIPGKPRN